MKGGIFGDRIKSTPELCQVATYGRIEGVRRYSIALSYVLHNHMSMVFVIYRNISRNPTCFPLKLNNKAPIEKHRVKQVNRKWYRKWWIDFDIFAVSAD